MKTKKTESRTPLPLVCPDYDKDCLDMTHEEAIQCYEGFPNNTHLMASGYGAEGIGLAYGRCPIIARLN